MRALPVTLLAVLVVGVAPTSTAWAELRIVSRVGDGAADSRPRHARKSEPVTLHAVFIDGVDDAGRRLAYADIDPVIVDGRTLRTRPWAALGPIGLEWHKVEPAVENMSNTESGSFAFEPVPYVETPMPAWRGRTRVPVDVHPTVTPDRGAGLGTMRFKVVLTRAGSAPQASPGASTRRGRGAGGLADSVHRVSVRAGDDAVGWMTEMYGQPYIWASAGVTDATHQSERLEGSDCADLVIYGRRRTGERHAYTWTGGLPSITKKLAGGTLDTAAGVYVDARGKPIAFPRRGDIVLFPRHVGVLVRDAGTIGVLDPQDVMLHTLFASPREQSLADSGYGGGPLEVRRF